jgi:hypothetical protein
MKYAERDHKGRIVLPMSAVELAEAKHGRNVSTVVSAGKGAEVFVKSGGQVVLRDIGLTRKPGSLAGIKAAAMKACRGKKGCDFMECLKSAGITAPKSIVKSCVGPTGARLPRPIYAEV